MGQLVPIRTAFRDEKSRKRNRLNVRKKGSVFTRNGKLWVDFAYLGERVRESSGLSNTPQNRNMLRKRLDLVIAQIENGRFEFARWFPESRKKGYFVALEGREIRHDPRDTLFGDYAKKWFEEMMPGMSASQIRDYRSVFDAHLLPFFEKIPFSEFTSVLMKKFVASLKAKKNRDGESLSAKRILNVMSCLRVVTKDAIMCNVSH